MKNKKATSIIESTETKDSRTPAWVFIVYPDSAPKDWVEKLDNLHIRVVISPLHDRDINPDGTPKKPHWHVILIFDGKKSFAQMEIIQKMLNSARPEPCASVNGMTRYTIHIDNPEKAQYNKADIRTLGGADIEKAFQRTVDKYLHIRDMIQFIKDNNITEYIDFMDYCATQRFDDWFTLLCDNCSFVIQGVITSNRNKLKEQIHNTYIPNKFEEEEIDNTEIEEVEEIEKVESSKKECKKPYDDVPGGLEKYISQQLKLGKTLQQINEELNKNTSE